MSEQILCCGQEPQKKFDKEAGMNIITCQVCGATFKAKTATAALAGFKKIAQGSPLVAQSMPQNAADLPSYMASRLDDLSEIAVPFVGNDRPALQRLVKHNLRYAMQADLKSAWDTPTGMESIVHAMEEALSLGAELGRMGSLVPYGAIVEFIPGVEAYEFALTNGGDPPFRWIMIDMIHENDRKQISRVNGSFQCDIQPGVPRGDLQAVAVYGHSNRLGIVVGEVYDVDRLMGKAQQHSVSYKYYLQDIVAFENADAADEVKEENGRKYIEKKMFKKGGGSWTKKLFADEITNPYVGADQPEMLRKLAGKSFLGKYVRIRNAEAAMDEMGNTRPERKTARAEVTLDINRAFDAVPEVPLKLKKPPSVESGEPEAPEDDADRGKESAFDESAQEPGFTPEEQAELEIF